MPPTADTVADEFVRFYGPDAWTDWLRLQAHFDFGDGFAFLILLLPGAVGAEICRRQLKQHLESQGKNLVELPFEWPEDARRLTERLFAIQPAASLGGIWLGTVISESDPEIKNWQQAWRHGLASLNQQRNPLRERFACPVVLVGAPWLQTLLRETAPDLWSVRTGVVLVTPSLTPKHAADKEFGVFEIKNLESENGETSADPDYLYEQAERLRDRPGLEAVRASLLHRAGNGFRDHERFPSAERCYREAAELLAKSFSNNSEAQAALAGNLNNLANALNATGNNEEALSKASDSVLIFEKLAHLNPHDFLPNLANSLNNQASILSELGQREEALAKSQEALRIREKLTKELPEAFLPDLASSQNNLAKMLADLGRHEESLAKAQEAMQIYEHLAKDRPDVFLPDLAMSLTNLANRLCDMGRIEEALAKAQDSVRIREQLAKVRTDVFLPKLANSLNNLGRLLGRLGRNEESLAKGQEVLRIYRQLIQTQPAVFMPYLASSLNNFANILQLLNRNEEALVNAQEAVRIHEQLAQATPDAYIPNLARSLGVQGSVFFGLGRYQDSASAFAKGLRVLTPLFQNVPSAFVYLAETLTKSYLQAIREAKSNPDPALLAPVQAVFEKLKSDPSPK